MGLAAVARLALITLAIACVGAPAAASGATIKGTVFLGSDPFPLGGEVRLTSGSRIETAAIGKDGGYAFNDVREGTYVIDAHFEEFKSTKLPICVRSGDQLDWDIDLPLPESSCCVITYPEPSETNWSGHVIDQRGRPVPHASITVRSPAEETAAESDGSGEFRVELPGDIRFIDIIANARGYRAVMGRGLCYGPAVIRMYPLQPCDYEASPQR